MKSQLKVVYVLRSLGGVVRASGSFEVANNIV